MPHHGEVECWVGGGGGQERGWRRGHLGRPHVAPRRVARTAAFLDPGSSCIHSAIANESPHRTLATCDYFWRCIQLRQLPAGRRCREQQRPQGIDGEQANVGGTTIVPNAVPEWPGSQGACGGTSSRDGQRSFIWPRSIHPPTRSFPLSILPRTPRSYPHPPPSRTYARPPWRPHQSMAPPSPNRPKRK